MNEERHGQWLWLTSKEAEKYVFMGMVTSSDNYICSECKTHITDRRGYNYCHNCGAKMDLVGKSLADVK